MVSALRRRNKFFSGTRSNLRSITEVTCHLPSRLATIPADGRDLEASHFHRPFIWGIYMRFKVLLFALLAFASFAWGKEPKVYQTGKLLQMDSVQCGMDEKDGKTFAGDMLGTDSGSKKTHELLCQEYLLQAEHVIYRIRPRDEKHPVLLPIGQKAQFRIYKDKMLLRIEDLDDREHEYVVVSMTLRIDGDTADATPSRVNHLQ
jgi:hypothetical protein